MPHIGNGKLHLPVGKLHLPVTKHLTTHLTFFRNLKGP